MKGASREISMLVLTNLVFSYLTEYVRGKFCVCPTKTINVMQGFI